MDPEATYRSLINLVGDILDENYDDIDSEEHLVSLAETFDALYGWIRKGGFLPGAWETNR